MSNYLNNDMVEAINSMDISTTNKEVIQQILMLEKREKNNPAAKNEIINACIPMIEKNYATSMENQL